VLEALGKLCVLECKIDEKTTVAELPQPGANQILPASGVSLRAN
jgi:hypothetical protein